VRSEVIIDERQCFGCGYCVQLCPCGCLERTGDTISLLGYVLPTLARPEECTGCGACAQICPRWAITVNVCFENQDKTVTKQRVAALPGFCLDPPLAGCPGCQHPTVGRMVTEVIDERGIGDKVIALDGIPCSISSAFGMDFGRKLAYGESAPDLATMIKRASPDALVIAVQGYWGLSDFSFDIGSVTGALIRGEKFTTILCNTPYYGPKDGRPVAATEPIEGRLEPRTRITTPEGQKLMVGGYPLRMAELVATFEGVVYSARGAITSLNDYQLTKRYIRTALQKQTDNAGLSFVEVLCACCDPTYSAPVDCLKWIEEKMIPRFPLGEFKNVRQQ
jgi:2-oxoglutarate ferredoxin oxidoreductase subunit beta